MRETLNDYIDGVNFYHPKINLDVCALLNSDLEDAAKEGFNWVRVYPAEYEDELSIGEVYYSTIRRVGFVKNPFTEFTSELKS